MAKLVDVVPKEDYQKLLGLLDDLSEILPSCIGCEGKKSNGERTEKCVYAKLSVTDNEKTYCIKRGIYNIHNILKENELLRKHTVSKGLYDQIKWERDVAIDQLKSCGVGLGEKADMQKVVHGEWQNDSGYDDWYCSECGFEINCDGEYPTEYNNFKYCGCCGAKMDGEK